MPALAVRGFLFVSVLSQLPWVCRYFNSFQRIHAPLLFSFRAGPSLFKDEVGEVFAEASLALQHVKRIALELARGGEPANAAIVVVEGDRQLFEVPLSGHRD